MLTERQQQVLQIVLTQPDATLDDIAGQIGVSRQRAQQIYAALREAGLQLDRKAQRKEAIDQKKQAEKAAREERKRTWRKMMFIGLRQRLRFMASIDHRGMVRGYHMPGEETICQFNGCANPVRARGFCSYHYLKLRSTGALWVRRSSRYLCKESGCYIPVYAIGLCRNHYGSFRRKNPTTSHIHAGNKSGYRGVSWSKTAKRWSANIRYDNAQKWLGDYDSAETAARAYDTAARKYHGEKARLNFPDENIEVQPIAHTKKIGVSGEPGVTWYEARQRWRVRITRNGESIFVGSFLKLDEAIKARDDALGFNEAAA